MKRTYTSLLAALLLLGLVALPMPGALAEAPECNDAIDNDGDGDVDYPDDPDCTAPEDDSEIHYDPDYNGPASWRKSPTENRSLTRTPSITTTS